MNLRDDYGIGETVIVAAPRGRLLTAKVERVDFNEMWLMLSYGARVTVKPRRDGTVATGPESDKERIRIWEPPSHPAWWIDMLKARDALQNEFDDLASRIRQRGRLGCAPGDLYRSALAFRELAADFQKLCPLADHLTVAAERVDDAVRED